MSIIYNALSTEIARALQAGATDANGHVPERAISSGGAYPCRHCLRDIPTGEPMLVLAHRPFPDLQPYAETGPIFLCAAACERHDGRAIPAIAKARESYLVKGYKADDRILYGTGAIVPCPDLSAYAEGLLARDDIAYVHVRSAQNNCYQFRIDRRRQR